MGEDIQDRPAYSFPSFRSEDRADPPSCPRNPLHVPERVPYREAFPTYFATQCRLTTPGSGPPGGAAAERVRSPAAGTPSDLLISTGTVGSVVSVRTWRRQYCPSHFDAPTPCQIIRSRPPLDAFQSAVSHSKLLQLPVVFAAYTATNDEHAVTINSAQGSFSKSVNVRAPPLASPRSP